VSKSSPLTTQGVLGTARRLGLKLQSSRGPRRAHKHSGLAVRKHGRKIGVLVGSDCDISSLCKLAQVLALRGHSIFHPLLKRTLCAKELTSEVLSNGCFLVA